MESQKNNEQKKNLLTFSELRNKKKTSFKINSTMFYKISGFKRKTQLNEN